MERKEREKELTLEFVINLKSFLTIIFKCNRNDTAMEVIDHVLEYNKEMINAEIFEVCLEYDEDISM